MGATRCPAADLYRSVGTVYVPPLGRRGPGGQSPRSTPGAGRLGSWEGGRRDHAEKWRDVCIHNGLFVAIPTVGENRDGIRQADGRAVRRCRCRSLAVAVVTQDGGIGRWRAVRAGPHPARPRPGGAGPRPRASALGPVHARVHPARYGASAPLRSAARAPGRPGAQPWHTRPLEHSLRETCGPGRRAVHARVHPPAPRGSGGCSHGIHVPTRGGLCGAVRRGAGCRSALADARPSRTAPGSGCPLRPRCGRTCAEGRGGPGPASLRTGGLPGRLRRGRPPGGCRRPGPGGGRRRG